MILIFFLVTCQGSEERKKGKSLKGKDDKEKAVKDDPTKELDTQGSSWKAFSTALSHAT